MTADIGLYVHLPWCVSKCPYCDFNSHALRGELPENAYLEALRRDLAFEASLLAGRRVRTVFFGGGTPSLFSGAGLGAFVAAIGAEVTLADDAEITIEANPGTLDRARLDAWRRAGVNRLSIGAQSFSAQSLQRLGRIHGPDEIATAVAAARGAGFDNFNLDLMYALPHQSLAGAVADVDAALALGPRHVSHYQLTLEPNTRFHHEPPPLPDTDAADEMQLACAERLAHAGLVHYEISAWARPGDECRHNLGYWRFGDYAGIGAGAHGKLTGPDGVRRRVRIAHPDSYRRRAGTADALHEHRPDPDTLVFEFLLNVLRLREGFALAALEAAAGQPPPDLEARLEAARGRGLLDDDGHGWWRPTPLGERFVDDILLGFLPAGAPPDRPSREAPHTPRYAQR